ncbi:acyl-CoA dehydrogenase family protein [Streptomyces mirabilis]|uniref:acyl-CoA dehydrogenase family protein n=1 Tax=Streptomyces mirabilis TaxID=68239 RepID=UPI00225A62FC|nr:acyl-CoA dehydrogenase family protein [Streptomyces mirabilis]MCX4428530.1 acyl-CoA dehydrogenase family protein [Streptomyces mirabilis]
MNAITAITAMKGEPTELVETASKLVPLLRSRSLWTDEHRRLSDDVVEALNASGLLKMYAPSQYGGFESSARTAVDVHAELARGNSSASFVVSVYALLNWMSGLWPDDVLDEVFATPNVKVCGTTAPSGTATPVDGGYLFTGRWGFTSGFLHSDWKITAAILEGGTATDMIVALIPSGEIEVVDDWRTIGLQGSGSVTTVTKDLFVPERRVIRTADNVQGQCYSEANSAKPLYQVPIAVLSTAVSVGQLVGAGKYALESFLERITDRGITYTNYAKQSEAPVTHLNVGEAALLVEEAEARAHRFADYFDAKVAVNEQWSQDERVRARVEIARVGQLAKQATDLLAAASGGSSLFLDVPIRRIQRDIDATLVHALLNPQTNIELYGRTICGLEPNTYHL